MSDAEAVPCSASPAEALEAAWATGAAAADPMEAANVAEPKQTDSDMSDLDETELAESLKILQPSSDPPGATQPKDRNNFRCEGESVCLRCRSKAPLGP